MTTPTRLRFRSALHHERTAAWLGMALGVSFTVCFATGFWSHLQQNPPGWFDPIARPAGLYRITQGIHVATGIASIPLLLAKLWVVYPKLFQRPVLTSAASVLEKISIIPLVGGGIFMLFTGFANINLWYPWPFNFRTSHYWVAWITIGALVVHIGAKFAITRDALSRAPERRARSGCGHRICTRPSHLPRSGGRRRRSAHARHRRADGVAAAQAGAARAPSARHRTRRASRSTAPPPRPASSNRRVIPTSASSSKATYAVAVELSVADLRALPQRSATLARSRASRDGARRRRGAACPSAICSTWPARRRVARVRVHSLQQRFAYASSDLDPDQARDRDTLLALEVEGEPLHLDHGFPVRLIGPNRPGVMQTKWVTRLVVS